MTGHSYHLHQTFASRFLVVMPVAMLAGAVLVAFGMFVQHGFVMPGAVLFPFWIAIAAFVAFQYLRMAHTIDWSDDNTIVFRSYLARISLHPNQIVAIEPGLGAIGILQIRHHRGKVLLLNQFTGFHDFVARLKNANPQVQLSGC